jgi:HAD superfamily hydrolase (TIGR01549 family)
VKLSTDHVELQRYRTWLFDCDGVLLDSNGIKTEAFRSIGNRYSPDVADRLVAHHVAYGGVSRYAKVDHLFTHILERAPAAGEMEDALHDFAAAVRIGLSHVAVEPHLHQLLDRIDAAGARSFVVSGGDQAELADVLDRHGIAQRFAGIHGNPRTKHRILDELAASGQLIRPAVFVGDSALDFDAARAVGADFVFVAQWTEFTDWRRQLPLQQIRAIDSLGDLVRAWVLMRTRKDAMWMT